MIEVKRVEIRDRHTMVPALAVRVTGGPADRLLWRAGFGETPCVYLIHLTGQEAHYDPWQWTNRTMHVAHLYLEGRVEEHPEAWESFTDGGVVDVEYLLHETAKPKTSEVSS